MDENKSTRRAENIRYALFITIFTMVAFEVVLREMHINETYSEKIGHEYVTYYGQRTQNIYNTGSKNITYELNHGDFKFICKTNELGLREKPVNEFIKDTAAYKIIALGDSYTEGVGAEYDSSWPRQLEYILKAQNKNVSVFDAGSSGSDPFFECKLYKEQLEKMNPNLIIMCINASDITDYIFRGGDERFDEKGWIKGKPVPWYEPLYHYSFSVRFFMNNILMREEDLFLSTKEVNKKQDEFVTVVTNKLKKFGAGLNTKLMVVILPMADEIAFKDIRENKQHYKAMSGIIEGLKGQKNIVTLDLYKSMDGTITEDAEFEYTYVHDKHFNARGYNMVAQYMQPAVLRVINDATY